MTDTANLALPFIEAGQAQKHVTHNEALRILDAAIQIAVLDRTRNAPPGNPAEGQRHVVAAGATGGWAGQGDAIATFQDGAWAFLTPHTGWCIWSVADAIMLVFDGAQWRDLRALPMSLDNAGHVGINTVAGAPELLSVRSNAAAFAAIATADGGSGDVRIQLSKESAAKTASVVFADNGSGRAEFGLVGADNFKLKVSADGANWIEAFTVDPGSGNLTLPLGFALTGVTAPPLITANQGDYNPAGLGTAAILHLASDAARSVAGLAVGTEGRVVTLINVGGQPITLLDNSAAATAANRFVLGGNLTLAARQAVILRYDGTAARWQAIAGATGLRAASNLSDLASASVAQGNLGVVAYANPQSLTPAQQTQAQKNLGLATVLRSYLAGLTLSTAGASVSFAAAAGVAADSGNTDMMTLSAAMTKTTAAWSAGPGNGALDAGSIAAVTWYHVHLIKRPDGGAVDLLLSTSATAPALPPSYTLWRRIGSMKTDASARWVKFVQNGDEFLWDVPVNDVNSTLVTSAPALAALSVPLGIIVWALLRGYFTHGTVNTCYLVQSPDEASSAAAATTGNLIALAPSAGGFASFVLTTRTNINGQVRHSSSSASPSGVNVALTTYGWIDRRGRDI